MTAEEFILILKPLYVREQPHVARVLHERSNKHNHAQLSYPKPLLPPQTSKTTATTETFTEKAEPPQEQFKLLTDDEKEPVECDKDEKSEEKNDIQTKSIKDSCRF